MFKTIFLSALFGLSLPLAAHAETWTVDASHSQVGFEVDHMMITTVKGYFGDFSGNLETNSKGKLVSMEGEVSIASVDTNDEKRDAHLQAADFFDAEAFPNMSFSSSKIKGSSEKGYTVYGDLTIRGVTKSVALELEPFKGPVVDGWGNTKVGTVATTTINRQDFGISWNSALDAGGVVVGDEVDITIDLQLIQSK